MAGGCAASPDPDVVELLFTARENVPATTAATSRMTMILKMVFIEYSFSFQLLFAGKLGRACASRPPVPSALTCFFRLSRVEQSTLEAEHVVGTDYELGSECSG